MRGSRPRKIRWLDMKRVERNTEAAVVVFAKPITQVQMDRPFWVTLFNDPVYTEVQLSPAGLTVARVGPGPVKNCQISVNRLQVQSDRREEVGLVFPRVLARLQEWGASSELNAYGLNFDFTFELEGVTDTSTWLAERFLKHGLAGYDRLEAKLSHIEFVVNDPEDAIRRQLKFAPVPGKANLIYAYVNNHFNVGMKMNFRTDWMMKEMGTWYDRSVTFVGRLLESGGA